MSKLKLAILRNEVADDHIRWELACKEFNNQIDWAVIDITKEDWLERIMAGSYDGLLASPPGWTTPFKVLYDERVTILHSNCGIPVYPSLEEIFIYEDKKYLSYWLKANNVPHPKTWVFYYKDEALDFAEKASFPLVGKTNMGASGSGVYFLHSVDEAKKYIINTFSGKGITRRVGPKWKRKGFARRLFNKLMHPAEFKLKIAEYIRSNSEHQKDFVILQQYIPHDFEWRCVRIGKSFFAHKKLKIKDKASGSLLKGYEDPPFELLDFVKTITDKRNFVSQAVDIFVNDKGEFLVNEMQCIFGQSDPYQMLINGQPGRYVHSQGQWIFEPGDFNKTESFQLRLENFLEILRNKNS